MRAEPDKVDNRPAAAAAGTSGAARAGGAAGAAAIALFVIGAFVLGERPPFDAPGAELPAWYAEERVGIQVAVLLYAIAGALLVWFLATIFALTRTAAAATAFGCGLVFVALFLADVTTMAVGAMRPVADPELAAALQDFELLAMGVAAPSVCGMLLALSRLELWPGWIRRLALLAAAVYALRAGTLFTDEGPFAGDGVLGIYAPVAALAAWTLLACGNLMKGCRHLSRARA